MRWPVLIVLVLIVFGAALGWIWPAGIHSQETRPDPSSGSVTDSARIVVPEPTHNLGVRYFGESIRHTFEIKNEGSLALTIDKGSKRQIAVEEITRRIAPFSSGRVTVVVHTRPATDRTRDGQSLVRTLRIKTSDPRQAEVVLKLEGTLTRMLRYSPNPGSLSTIVGVPAKGQIEIEAVPDDIRSWSFVSKTGKVLIDRTHELEPGKRWRLDLTGLPAPKPQLARDQILARLVLAGGKSYEIPVPIHVYHGARYKLSERRTLKFMPAETDLVKTGEASVSRAFTVRALPGERSFRVVGVELDRDLKRCFEADIWIVEPGREYRIDVTLTREMQNFVKGTLTIRTDNPSFPAISKTVTARFR